MRPTLPLFAALLAAAAPAAGAEHRYSVTDFDRVQVEGPYRVVLSTGLPSSARAIGSQAALDRLSVEVQGRTLKVRANRSAWGSAREATGPVTIELTTRDLQAGAVNGSGSLAVDKARGLRLDLSVAGSGQLSVGRVEADNLLLAVIGAGRMSVSGRTKQLRATVQGSGDLEAPGLSADDATLFAETAGRVSFSAERTAKVRATGMGEVEIAGRAKCDVEMRGSGAVSCGAPR